MIAGRIVLLVVLSVLAATIVNLAITFGGPPPMPAPYRLDDIAAVLQGGQLHNNEVEIISGSGAPIARSGERRDGALETGLARRMGVPPGWVVGFVQRVGPGRGPPRQGEEIEIRGSFTAGLIKANGDWRVMRSKTDAAASWQRTVVVAMLATLLLLTLIAWWVARAIVRPMSQLANAADAVHARREPDPVSVSGPPEVQRVAAALNAMRDRLVAHVAANTSTLAAITHDLGTPLTRLSFHIEHLPDAARERARADIDEMRAMIIAVLEYARGETGEHARVDIAEIIDALADDMAQHWTNVRVWSDAPLVVRGAASGIRRLLANLVENAMRYGSAVELQATKRGSEAVISVSDNGPGFAPEIADRLFDQFFRGESARGRDTGGYGIGVGLGLAIARNIVDAHGGTISARNAETGGAVFEVRLRLVD